jgi:hypothetical protein
MKPFLKIAAGVIVLAASTLGQEALDRLTPQPQCAPMPTQMRGARDDFNPANGNEPNFQSPQVKQVLAGKPQRGFDAPAGQIPQDQNFGTSFVLGCCKITKPVTVTMVIRRASAGLAGNDKAHVFLGTPTGIGAAVFSEDLWLKAPYNTQTTRTVVFTLQPAQVNAHIFNNSQPFIDVLMQDDSIVDYVMLQN